LARHSRILSSIGFIYRSNETFETNFKQLNQIVNECRRELTDIDSITFSESKESFDWIDLSYPCVVIDIMAKGIEFQVVLMVSHK
jgi:hypothetical protein